MVSKLWFGFGVVLGGLLLSSWAAAQPGSSLFFYAATTNNSVTGTIIHDTWDPGDPLTISGDLHDNNVGDKTIDCYLGALVANATQATWVIEPPSNPQNGLGHIFCGATPHIKTFVPGTNAAGHFSLTASGGGVSWLIGSGYDPENNRTGSTMRLDFTKGGALWSVLCGDNSGTCPRGFPCDNAPHVYGVLASPDLTGDGFIDSSDNSALSALLGLPITCDRGWQADFNHTGGSVNASDVSYYSGRIGHNCSQGKATDTQSPSYDMDVRNLSLDSVEAWLGSLGITAAEVIGHWDEMQLSYDRVAAEELLRGSGKPTAQNASWSQVKTLYN